jgi:hypothetical protein
LDDLLEGRNLSSWNKQDENDVELGDHNSSFILSDTKSQY